MRKSIKNNSEIRTAVDTNCLGQMICQHSKGLLNLSDILIRKHYINYMLVFILRQKTLIHHTFQQLHYPVLRMSHADSRV